MGRESSSAGQRKQRERKGKRGRRVGVKTESGRDVERTFKREWKRVAFLYTSCAAARPPRGIHLGFISGLFSNK